jgi:flagellar protein FlaG
MDIKSIGSNQVSAPELGVKAKIEKVQSQPKPEKAKVEPSPAEINKAVQKLQTSANLTKGDIEFSTDQDSGRSVVKVVDRTTKDILMQFPSKQALELAKNIENTSSGTLVNQKA